MSASRSILDSYVVISNNHRQVNRQSAHTAQADEVTNYKIGGGVSILGSQRLRSFTPDSATSGSHIEEAGRASQTNLRSKLYNTGFGGDVQVITAKEADQLFSRGNEGLRMSRSFMEMQSKALRQGMNASFGVVRSDNYSGNDIKFG